VRMPLALTLPLLAALLPQARNAVVEGVVTDPAGTPIVGAVIDLRIEDVVISGADGRFRIRHSDARDPWLRFTADGYEPANRPVSSLLGNAAVVLRPTTAEPHILPTCSGALARQSSPFHLRVPPPRGVPRKEGGGVDAVNERWQSGKAWLRHSSGILTSFGYPASAVLRRLAAVEDRDVRLPIAGGSNPSAPLVVDLKGAYADGRLYRFVGVVFENFEYDEASAEEAALFDRILDTMCYRP
jgi:hypothetical protein